MDALRPERLGGERRGERRVDSAGDADHDVAEAVLLDVVAQAELEREPHLLQVVQHGRDRSLHVIGLLGGRADVDRLEPRNAAPLARERASPRVCEPAGDRLAGLDVDDEQALLEARAPARARSPRRRDERVPVEDELVLAADGVAEREEARVVPRARDEHRLALAVLADVERRGGQVRDQLRAREGEVGRRRAGLPHVLADGRPDQDLAVLEQHELVAGREVAVLVEDAVVRQEALLVDRAHLAAGADGAGVEEVAVEDRRADERHDAACRERDLLERALRRADEPGPQQEVLGRVAGDGELREEDEVGARLAGLLEPAQDLLPVPVQVADDGVDLCECEPHGLRLRV